MYLIPSDYDYQVRQEIKGLLAGESIYRLERAEKSAVDQMKSYLKRRYDVEALFPILEEYNEVETYATSDLAFWKLNSDPEDKFQVYEALENVTNIPPSDVTKWKLYTGRNSFIIMYLVDITLYHLMSRFPKHFEVRSERYKEAIEWLKMVAAGEIDANLPQLEISDSEKQSYIRWGSHIQENQQW